MSRTKRNGYTKWIDVWMNISTFSNTRQVPIMRSGSVFASICRTIISTVTYDSNWTQKSSNRCSTPFVFGQQKPVRALSTIQYFICHLVLCRFEVWSRLFSFWVWTCEFYYLLDKTAKEPLHKPVSILCTRAVLMKHISHSYGLASSSWAEPSHYKNLPFVFRAPAYEGVSI